MALVWNGTDFWQAGGSDTECESDTDVEGERSPPRGAVYRCGMDSDCGAQVRLATLSMTTERRQCRRVAPAEASYGLVPAGHPKELVQFLPAQWKDTLEAAVVLLVFQRGAQHLEDEDGHEGGREGDGGQDRPV
eukprot:CAMPEP_0118819564 /NCGR_PEP_ID=MMETSP1162-20130426/7052_1 /TAXON_ID=33656 /ORGANISM="Phaeocystis Sp, Strain CCMP2710" /LENGTH=133 /DNA_ID=CAMNT_0006749863 /DNA_START=69 /DNA_END=471 /DNA_ORIENTATION=-